MAEITVEKSQLHPEHTFLYYEAKEGATVFSSGRFQYINTRFGDHYIKTMIAGGVASPVQFRRSGHVRKIFEQAYRDAADAGVVTALLHPFSFAYYEKFGYGKVADHLIARCPVHLIDFVDRYNDLVPYTNTPEQTEDLISVYNRFTQGRLLMFHRYNTNEWKDRETYIYYENGKPSGYISFTTNKELFVNHYINTLMTVHEIAYTTPNALRAILGFIRMFEGEFEEVEFTNLEVCPEIQLLLRHETHTFYRRLPDLMARIINPEALLLAQTYPAQAGTFSVRIEDAVEVGTGSFRVEYGNGDVAVKRLSNTETVDMTLSMPAFSRLVYGYDGASAKEAQYMHGVTVSGNADDFFRAFTKRPIGVFEHF